MKELKDLLKANKYLEAKAFILSNLDKVEECVDVVLEELADPFENWIAQNVDKSILPHESSVHPRYVPPPQYADAHQKDKDAKKCPATLKVGGKTVLKFDGISVKVDDKGKIICGGVANMGDEHNIVDPKGVDMSYLRAYYDTPNEKIDTLIKKAIDNKKETP